MPEYRHLTRDELLRLAHENADLTDEARLLLDAEFARRGLSNDDLRSFEDDQAAATTASQKEVREVSIRGIGKRLMGRTNYSHDPGLRIEEFDATLWVVRFGYPSFLWPPTAFAGLFDAGGIFVLQTAIACLSVCLATGSRFSARGSRR